MDESNVEIDWTPFALGCLDEIYDFVAFDRHSPDIALKLIEKIFDRTEQLKNFPESGPPEPLLKEIGQNSRYLVESSYKIIYEYHPVHKVVIVTDIFQTSQNPTKMERSGNQ